MAYMLPLRFAKVANRTSAGSVDVAVCATRIVAIMGTECNYARRTIKKERDAGTLVNAAGRDKVKCAIWLDNGTVIASPLSVNRVLRSIEKSNEKASGKFKNVQAQVYEVEEGEADEDLAEEVLDVSCYDEEEEGDVEENNAEELLEEELTFENAESDEEEDFASQ